MKKRPRDKDVKKTKSSDGIAKYASLDIHVVEDVEAVNVGDRDEDGEFVVSDFAPTRDDVLPVKPAVYFDSTKITTQLFSDNPFTSVKGTGAGRPRERGVTTMPKKKNAIPEWGQGEVKTYEPNFDFGEIPSMTPSDADDFDELKGNIQPRQLRELTIVFAIAIDKERDEANVPTAIRCHGGIPFGGYIHDMAKDSYIIRCADVLQLGTLGFAYQISMPKIGEWKIKVPIPEKVIEKHLSPDKRKILDDYRNKYRSPRYEVNFIQMLGCNV